MEIACVLGQGFEDSEFPHSLRPLEGAGLPDRHHRPEKSEELKGYRGKVKVERSIDEVSADDYDALLIPGGQSPDHLRVDKRMVEFVKAFEKRGKLIAVVCNGPQLRAAAHLIKGRTLTAWQTIQDDLQQMGANVKDEPVVIDRNWITNRKPEDLEQFAEAIIERLEGEEGSRTPRDTQPAAQPLGSATATRTEAGWSERGCAGEVLSGSRCRRFKRRLQ